jgi:hypothetical protein
MGTIKLQQKYRNQRSYDAEYAEADPAGVHISDRSRHIGVLKPADRTIWIPGGMPTAGLVAPISEFMHNGELVIGRDSHGISSKNSKQITCIN